MKKILSIVFAGAALMSLVACSDSDYSDKYTDPSKTSTVGVPQVFTAIQYKGNTWMNPMYMRCFTQTSTSGTFSGIMGNANAKSRYLGAGESYFNNRWKSFYDMLTQYRLLESTYNALDEGSEKEADEVFVKLGQVMIYSQLHEMCSLFGDVPFTGAGTLWATSDYDKSKASDVYDDDVELYKTMLSDLKTVGDFLSGSLNSTGLASLKSQDITFAAGDQDMWRRYTNSLRLRIALHLVNGDLASEAKAAIAEILNNPTKYPVIENNAQNMGVATSTNNDDFNFGKSFSQGLHTWGTYSIPSQAVLDVMGVKADGTIDANSDPRVETMLDPNPDGNYVAYDVTKSSTELSNEADAAGKRYAAKSLVSYNYWVQVDSVAMQGLQEYQGNMNLNGIWMSAAEVALSKAECYLMGYGVSADPTKAHDCFVDGVAFSTAYYANLKTTSTLYTAGTDDCAGKYRAYVAPTETEARAYAEKLWTLDPSQETIVSQNWLNHFVFNELEAWNLVRRTGYPVVEFASDALNTTYANPPLRLPYPSDEINSNTANYNAAKAKNYSEDTGFYTKLFWSKDKYYKIVANK